MDGFAGLKTAAAEEAFQSAAIDRRSRNTDRSVAGNWHASGGSDTEDTDCVAELPSM